MEKSMKKSNLYYLISICFYIVAVIKFFDSGFSSGAVWFCLGSAFLCFGADGQNKDDKSDGDDSSNEK